MDDPHAAAAGLETALDDLHRCLLAGRLDDLPKILDETARLTAALSSRADPAVMARLRHKADRNGQCLLAAARGLRAARRRIGETGGQAGGLSTYTRAGRRAEMRAPDTALTQRL